MKLYVTRHGQTDYNVNKIMMGHKDIPLNETGIKQAKETSQQLKDIKFDIIISSPLQRARKTAEIINVNNVPIIYDDRLKERDCGELTDKKHEDVDREAYWNYNDNTIYESAENVQEFLKRIYNFIDEIKEKYQDKTVLLVTHCGITRAINCYFNGVPENGDLRKMGINNCEVKIYDL